MSWLYRTETKGIQQWILSSGKLRDLVGGSLLIEDLVKHARERVGSSGEVLTAAAGGMTVRFEDKAALEGFASGWPREAYYRAPGLHVIQAWCEVRSGEEKRALDHLHGALLASARNRPWPSFPEAGAVIERTAWSGLPALQAKARAEGRPGLLDRPSERREAMRPSQDGDSQTFPRLGAVRFNDPDRWGERPVAVVHADGSGIGAAFMKAAERGLSSVKAFSEALAESTVAATRQALTEIPTERGAEVKNARPIVLGGDDLTIVLEARYAYWFARAWLQAFEAETEQRKAELGGKLRAGAGIAIVHRKFPFDRAHDLAEAACKDAKRVARGPDGMPADSALAIVRNTAALPDAGVATGYRLGELHHFENLCGAVEKHPRGSLREWLALREARDPRAAARWERLTAIAQPRGALEKELTALGARDGVFANDDPRAGSTPIADALALLAVTRLDPAGRKP